MINNAINFKLRIIILIISYFIVGRSAAQFLDNFNSPAIKLDPSANNGWTFYTGDGSATMDLQQREDYASILVDATRDQRNIWWALIRRRVSANFDLSQLIKPNFEFRIEARIRVSHAPRRVNLHLNTQRTTDFHSHLMEFDIPDTTNWHTISMTTHHFDARPGDRVYGQLALMDWGLEKYRVDIDHFKVDIVHIDTIGPDKGIQVPYHPPIPDVQIFKQHLEVAQDCIIDVGVNEKHSSSSYITISNPVLQRMIDGKTLGITLRPLGAINASFYSMENKNRNFSAKLYFNVYDNSN